MKNRRRFECVYAGPPIYNDGDNAENGGKPENGRKEYPDSFKQADAEPPMECVYAGPDMMNDNNARPAEPLMQAVYACPPRPPASNDQAMMCVYAGPQIMRGKKQKKMLGAFAPKRRDAEMREVYAGPEMMEHGIDASARLVFCPSCGAKNGENAGFCSSCGASISGDEAKPQKKKTLRKGFFARLKGNRDELV